MEYVKDGERFLKRDGLPDGNADADAFNRGVAIPNAHAERISESFFEQYVNAGKQSRNTLYCVLETL